jgi:predicted amidohydrolase
MKNFTASVIQFSNFKHNQLKDTAEIFAMIKHRVEELHSTDLIVLPELTTIPYIMNKQNIADGCSRYNIEMEMYKEIAIKSNKYILAAGAKCVDNKAYNTAFLIGPDGNVLGEYKKNHIPSSELEVFTQGNGFSVIQTPIATFGILLCYDAQFPESFRILKQMGAEVVLLPVNSVVDFHEVDIDIDNWMATCKYNALVNSLYIIMANKVEEIGTSRMFHTGHSVIIGPFGEIVTEGSMREQSITGVLNSECFEKYQSTYSIHRRNDLYEKFIPKNHYK